MADRVRVVSSGGSGPGRFLPIGLVAVALIAVVVAFVVGRVSAPSHHSAQTVTSTVSSPSQPSPSGVQDGVAVGYPHTKAGAVAALLSDGQTLSNPQVLFNASRRSKVLSLIATSAYAQTFAGSALSQAERQTPLGRGILSGAKTVFLAVPISYRVVSYAPSEIKVVSYSVSVVANDQGLSPRSTWATTTTTAVWQDGGWRVSAASSSDGPTPALTDRPSTATSFLGGLSSEQEVHDAP
jgi:hypothetical protein